MNFMMTAAQPFMALIDDDPHSARLMTRMLLAQGAPSIEVFESADAGAVMLMPQPNDAAADMPDFVIVDLKQSSTATADFVAALRRHPRCSGLIVVAMTTAPDAEARRALIESGANAVFERHADIDAYRSEVAAIVNFWVRHQHLTAIGT